MLATGTILQDRYEIFRLLGAGGMGAVYLAHDLRLGNRLVVVKENVGGDSQQFQIEANILASLSHPNLPRVSDHFVEASTVAQPSGAQYLVMDYVEGQNLEEIVRQRGALVEKDALAWMAQIFDAVKYLHANRIIHRDIKPQNIIITPQGKAMLVDFGIAKVVQPGKVTATGAHGWGSPGYAPPEQYAGGTDERSDVYALGATLYFALTGKVPQDAASRAAGGTLVAPRQINSAISPNVETAIAMAMNLSASERLSSVSALEQSLKRQATTPVVSPGKTLPSQRIERKREKSRLEIVAGGLVKGLERRVELVIAALVSVLIIIVGLYACGVFPPGVVQAPGTFVPRESIHDYNVHRLATVASLTTDKILGIAWLPNYDGPFVVMEKAVMQHIPGTDQTIKIADLFFIEPGSDHVLYLPPPADLTAEFKNDRTCSVRMPGADGKPIHILFPDRIGAMSINLQTLSLGLGFDNGAIAIVSSKGQIDHIRTEVEQISALAFTPDGNTVVYSGNDKKIRSRVIGTPRETPPLGELECVVRDIEFSIDGNWAAAAGDCPRIQVWNLQKKGDSKLLDPRDAKPEGIASIAFAPGARVNLLASAGTDGHLRIWNVADGSKRFDVDSGQRPLKEVLFSPDGRWLVSVGQNNTIKFWAAK